MADKKKFGDVPTMFSLDNKPSKPAPVNPSKLEPEYGPTYQGWVANQNPKSNDDMVLKMQPLIDSAVKAYVGQDVPPSVRLQAKRMALDGLKTYDPMQSKLKTHIMWHMQGLKRISSKANQILNVPERVRLDSHYIDRSFNELEDKLGRDPSDYELSEHTGLSAKRIGKVRGFKSGISEGAASAPMVNSDNENSSDPSSVIPGRDTGAAWRGFVYDGLDDRSKLIMEHTLGMHGKPVLDNIRLANKLRISPARVSQIRAELQNKMDGRERMGIL